MKKFLAKSTLVFIPILVVLTISLVLLIRVNEHLPLSIIIKQQQQSKTESYYNRELFENVLDIYKYNTMVHRKPEILAIGQSIVLCYRDFFFAPFQDQFYNTGLMIRNPKDLEVLTDELVNGKLRKPRYILFGLDHSFVLSNTPLDKKSIRTSLWQDPIYNSRKQLRALQSVLTKSDVRKVPEINVGFGKRGMNGNGYRKDGSCHNRWEIDMYSKDSTHIEGILIDDFKNHRNGYPMPMTFDTTKSKKVIVCLNTLRKNGIEILIYIPPLSDQYFNHISKFDYVQIFWKQFMAYQNELSALGFKVIPFATPSQMGLTDDYMLNSDHPGEILVAKQFLKFYQEDSIKGPISRKFNLAKLDALINQSNHPLSFELEPYQIQNQKK